MHVQLQHSFFSPILSGPERKMHRLIDELLARGHRVSVVAAENGYDSLEPYVKRGIRFYIHPKFQESGWRKLIEPFTLPEKLRVYLASLYAQEKPDLVLCFNHYYVIGSRLAFPDADIAYLPGSTIRDWYSWITANRSRLARFAFGVRTFFAERAEGRSLEMSNAVFLVKSVQRDLERLHSRRTRVNYLLWPIPVDNELFRPSPISKQKIRAEFNVDDGQKLLVCVGRLQWNKNFRVLVEALNALPRKDFRLLVIGRGPERAMLEQLAKRGPHRERITFVEARDDMEKIYAGADIFLHPALVEPYGNVVQEAMSSGLSCILSGPQHIGFCEHVTDEKNALLTAPQDVSAWSAKIERLLSDDALRSRLGTAARALIESRAGWTELTDMILNKTGRPKVEVGLEPALRLEKT